MKKFAALFVILLLALAAPAFAAWEDSASVSRIVTPSSDIAILGDSLSEMHNSSITISALSQSAGMATATCASHGLTTGDQIRVLGADQGGYNGVITVTAVADASHFSYAVNAATTSPATGTITAMVYKRIFGSSWPAWFLGRLGGGRVVLNAGRGGEDSAEILARVGSVIASGAGTVFVWAGHNDLFWDAESSPTLAYNNIRDTCNALLTAGRAVVLLTCEPDSGEAGITATIRRHVLELNQLIRAYAESTPGVMFVDAYAALVDSADTDGLALDGVHQADKVHFDLLGADLVGEAIYNAIGSRFAVVNPAPSGQLLAANQVFANPLQLGTGGTVLTATGTAPDSTVVLLQGTGSCVSSVAARTAVADGDTFGNNHVLTWSAQNGDLLVAGAGDFLSGVGSYTRFWSVAHIQITNADLLSNLKVGLFANVDSAEYWATGMEWYTTGTSCRDLDLYIRSPALILPGGATGLAWRVVGAANGAGTITIKIGRLGIFGE